MRQKCPDGRHFEGSLPTNHPTRRPASQPAGQPASLPVSLPADPPPNPPPSNKPKNAYRWRDLIKILHFPAVLHMFFPSGTPRTRMALKICSKPA